MKVKDVMTRDVQSCGADTNLAEAAKMMWDSDCGAGRCSIARGK